MLILFVIQISERVWLAHYMCFHVWLASNFLNENCVSKHAEVKFISL